MVLKIYFGDKPLFLCDELTAEVEPYVHHDDAVFIDELNSHTVKTMIHEMESPEVHAGVFYHRDMDALRKAFFKKFSVVTAAGGLVRNPHGELLLIFRRGKWDLPKGKAGKNEKLEDTALREVREETGVTDLILDRPLGTTYHTYHEGSRHILKESHWWLMASQGEGRLKPQTEEDITDIKWLRRSELAPYLDKSFPLIRDLLQGYED